MAKIEPGVYEPRGDDIRVFDGTEDDMDEEGSRLPLLIVIALLVLAAFAGVVYLAYTEGVQKGRLDQPRVITAQPGPAKVAPTDAGGTVTPYKGLKIYEQPAPTDEEAADEDSAPPPPTEVSPAKNAAAATATPTPAPTASAQTKPVPNPTLAANAAAATPKPTTAPKPTATTTAVKPPATSNTQVATAAPRTLVPETKPVAAKPTPVEAKAQPAVVAPTPTPAAASTSAGGSYVLQIGAYKSEAEANAAFAALKGKNGALMSGFSPNIKQVDLGGKGIWYRLRVGSFADKDAAAALCQRLGGGCFPAKP